MSTDDSAPISSRDLRSELGLSDDLLREIIGLSIGVPNTPLPTRLEKSLELVGLFRAKQLSYELLLTVRDARLAVKRMRIKLANREPTDGDWVVIQYDYAEVWTERDLIRTRIDEDCRNWKHYKVLAGPIYRELDKFCAAIRMIAQGYIPKGLPAVGKSRFSPEPELQDFAKRVEYYDAAVECVWVKFADWLKACDDLYGKHCELLDSEPRNFTKESCVASEWPSVQVGGEERLTSDRIEPIDWLIRRLRHRVSEATQESDLNGWGIATVLEWLVDDERVFEQKYRVYISMSTDGCSHQEFDVVAQQLIRLRYRCRTMLVHGIDPGDSAKAGAVHSNNDQAFTFEIPPGANPLKTADEIDQEVRDVPKEAMRLRFEQAAKAISGVVDWISRGDYAPTPRDPVEDCIKGE